ncbi:universal stress protein [Tahibacter sp. UC22_41]|uniref:universal stress protein n=1 Tax=Tahibacter sp. UC22_41 TaxID=3350178 RepID=UPI0036DBDEA8
MKLLVAIDASESGERLLDYVALHWLPRDPSLAIVLYHARGVAAETGDGDPLRYARAVCTSVGLPWVEHTTNEAPAAGILRVAAEIGADAIVLGARDRAVSRPLGAVATQVLAASDTPVLVVP